MVDRERELGRGSWIERVKEGEREGVIEGVKECERVIEKGFFCVTCSVEHVIYEYCFTSFSFLPIAIISKS